MHAAPTTPSTDSAAEAGVGALGAMTGLGILTLALFPFAIPFLVLTLAFTAPLLVLGAAAVLPIAIIAGLVLAFRAIRARIGARPGAPRGDESAPALRSRPVNQSPLARQRFPARGS